MNSNINISILNFLFLFNVVLFILILINISENNLLKSDDPNYTSVLYQIWTQDSNPSNTVTIKKNRVNKIYNLSIKNSSFIDINIILPLATECNDGDYITFIFKDSDENLGRTYYFFENYVDSIFNENTYFINILYKKVKLIVVDNKWTQFGCGVIESP